MSAWTAAFSAALRARDLHEKLPFQGMAAELSIARGERAAAVAEAAAAREEALVLRHEASLSSAANTSGASAEVSALQGKLSAASEALASKCVAPPPPPPPPPCPPSPPNPPPSPRYKDDAAHARAELTLREELDAGRAALEATREQLTLAGEARAKLEERLRDLEAELVCATSDGELLRLEIARVRSMLDAVEADANGLRTQNSALVNRLLADKQATMNEVRTS